MDIQTHMHMDTRMFMGTARIYGQACTGSVHMDAQVYSRTAWTYGHMCSASVHMGAQWDSTDVQTHARGCVGIHGDGMDIQTCMHMDAQTYMGQHRHTDMHAQRSHTDTQQDSMDIWTCMHKRP